VALLVPGRESHNSSTAVVENIEGRVILVEGDSARFECRIEESWSIFGRIIRRFVRTKIIAFLPKINFSMGLKMKVLPHCVVVLSWTRHRGLN